MIDIERANTNTETELRQMETISDVEKLSLQELQAHIDWLEVEKDHQLSLKDVNCYDKIHEITQLCFQKIDSLKEKIQVLTKEKEDQQLSYEKQLTQLKEKHAEELKDLELSHGEIMLAGFERKQELRNEIEMLQQQIEDKMKELQESEESHLRAMEETKQAHEAIVQDLKAKLEEEVKSSEGKRRKVKDKAESELMDLCFDFECDLRAEREARMHWEDELGVMKMSDAKLKSKIEKQELMIKEMQHKKEKLKNKLKDERQSIMDLKSENEQLSQMISDKDLEIEELQETVKNLDTTCATSQAELTRVTSEQEKDKEESDERSIQHRLEMERLTKELEEVKETFRLTGDEFTEAKRKFDVMMAEKNKRLKAMHQVLTAERQEVADADAVVHRVLGDLIDCARFIDDPKKLKEKFMEVHTRHIHKHVKIVQEEECMKHHDDHMKLSDRVLAREKKRWAKEMNLVEERCARLVKENGFWITQMNEQSLREKKLQTNLKEMRAQCANNAASSSAILPGKTRHVPLPPVNPRPKSNLPVKRHGQVPALQSSPGHAKLPPINITTKKII